MTELDRILQAAIQHHQSGRYGEAEQIYRQILASYPRHADALHLLGVLAGQLGHVDAAISLVENAVQVKPDFADAFVNLGRLHADKGNYDHSVAAYRKAVDLRPTLAAGWYTLGLALRLKGDADQASKAFETCINLDPNAGEAYSELGSILKDKEKFDDAIAAYRRALSLKPDFAEAHNNLANALASRDQIDEAISEYRLAIQLKPDRAVFHANLGDGLRRLDRFNQALESFNAALALEAENVQALSSAGATLSDLRRYEEAIALHDRALALKPGDASALRARAETLFAKRDMTAAETGYLLALEADPKNAALWVGLGTVRRSFGRFDEAAKCFQTALEINPDDTSAFKNLAAIVHQSEGSEIGRLTKLLDKPDLSEEDRITAGFAIGKLLDDDERYDEAFKHYSNANTLYRNWRAIVGDKFDPRKLSENVDETIRCFTREFFHDHQEWGDRSELPVFVVGMPRSGTTLVEQIAASHSKIFGAGELNDIFDFAASLNHPRDVHQWQRNRIDIRAKTHLENLKRLGGDAKFVIDKCPANVLYLGLIATLFPKARVIFCKRDPLDNCLSCYFQWFTRNAITFSYDLADCATQYLEQERLTAHWLEALPLRMLTVQYEEMVGDLEGQSRRLIDFLGLDWEPACLDFYNTQRTVLTASVWQVRQPIYTSSVGRWRHYKSHLGPLFDALHLPAE